MNISIAELLMDLLSTIMTRMMSAGLLIIASGWQARGSVEMSVGWLVVGNCRSQDTAKGLCPPPWMIVIAVFVKSKHPDMTRPPNVTANHQLHLNLCFDQGDRFLGSCPLIPRQTPFDWLVMGFFVGRGPPVVISVIKLPRKSIVNWKLTFLNGDPLFTPRIPTLA